MSKPGRTARLAAIPVLAGLVVVIDILTEDISGLTKVLLAGGLILALAAVVGVLAHDRG